MLLRDSESNTTAELEQGRHALELMPHPVVAVFCASKLPLLPDHIALAQRYGRALAQAGISTLTGGGPGLMAKVSQAAFEAGGHTVGLCIDIEQQPTAFLHQRVDFTSFAARKQCFFEHADAFLALPGGIGTLDEVLSLANLIKTGKVPARPLFLAPTEFWQGCLDWLQQQPVALGLIEASWLAQWQLSDDPAPLLAAVAM